MNTKDTPMDYKQFEGHTPGPWKVRTKEEFELTNDLYHSIRAINGPSFDEPGFDITGCISWVDASLIAAAPDLLKENKELKLELQKQKALCKTAIALLDNIMGDMKEEGGNKWYTDQIEDLIKQSESFDL